LRQVSLVILYPYMSQPRHPTPPSAKILTPDELLANAEKHWQSSDPNMMRAAVLEAIAALETFVYKRVFSSLRDKLNPLLVKWLEDKTRMDFDSRLAVLTPVAVGRPVDKREQLWKHYKDAKAIRNAVTHSGASVSREQARFVINTVYSWLAFLGSRVEVQVALIGLKRYFHRRVTIPIQSEHEAVDLIVRYFSKTKAAEILREPMVNRSQAFRPDIILRFGDYTVIIEAKFSQEERIQPLLDKVVEQVTSALYTLGASVGAAVIFYKGKLDSMYSGIHVFEDGRIYVLIVQV
jgi:hypothetical protein